MSRLVEMVETLNRFNTSLEIGTFLQLQGVKGDTGDSDHCVISQWLRDGTGMAVTTDEAIHVYRDYAWDDETMPEVQRFEITGTVVQFIAEFDNGKWPQLEYQYDEWGAMIEEDGGY